MRFVLGALLLVAATCRAPSGVSASTSPNYQAMRLSWAAYLHAKALDSAIDQYAVDAVFVTTRGQRIVGSAAIRKLFAEVMKEYNATISLHPDESRTSGQEGYDSGRFDEVLIVRKTGAAQREQGKYITIFRHEPSGRWLIVKQSWFRAQSLSPGQRKMLRPYHHTPTLDG